MAPSYTQVMSELTVGFGSWTQVATGAPANSVVEILCLNTHLSTAYITGVKSVGSGLERSLLLNEAEGGGVSAVRFLANADGSGNVWIARPSGPQVFYLVGYWEGVTFTEQWESHNVGAKEDDTWWTIDGPVDLSLQANRVHLITVGHDDNGKNQVAGVREVGSGLERSIDMMEAEGLGYQCADWYVQTDGSGDIQVYTAQYDDHTFFNQGYFEAAIDFTEAWLNFAANLDNNTWSVRDLTAYIDVAGRVVDFLVSNYDESDENLMGIRTGGTALARYVDLRESEGSGYSCYGLTTQTDGVGVVEVYNPTYVDANPIWYRYSGYFNVGEEGGESLSESLADTITTQDSMLTKSSWYNTYFDSTSIAEYVVKSASHLLADALDIEDFWNSSLFGELTQSLFDAVTLTEYIVNSMTTYTLQSLTMVDTRISSYSMDKIDTATLLDTTLMSYLSTMVEAMNVSDYLVYLSTWYTTLVDSIGVNDYMAKVIGILTTETLNILDYIASSTVLTRLLFDPLSMAFTQFSTMSKSLIETPGLQDFVIYVWDTYLSQYDSLNLLDYLTTTIVRILDLIDTTNITSYLRGMGIYKVAVETLSLLDYIDTLAEAEFFRLLEDFTTVSDYLTYEGTFVRTLVETITLLDLWTYSITGLLTQALTDQMSLLFYHVYESQWERHLIDTQSLTGYLLSVWTTSYLVSETLTLLDFADTITSQLMSLFDPMSTSDFINTIWTATNTLTDTITLSDLFSKLPGMNIIDTIEMINYLVIDHIKRMPIDALQINDYLVHLPSVLMTQAVQLIDSLSYESISKRVYTDTLNLISYILSTSTLRTIFEAISIPEFITWESETYRTLLEPITFLDYILPVLAGQLFKSLTEITALVDYLTRKSTTERTLYDAITTSLFPSITIGKYTLDQLDIADYMVNLSKPLMAEVILLNEYVTKSVETVYYNTLNIEDLWFYNLVQELYQLLEDFITLSGYLSYESVFERVFYLPFTIPDTLAKYAGTYMIESTTVSDYIIKATYPVMVEPLSIVDLFYKVSSIIGIENINLQDIGTYVASFTRVSLESISLLDYIDYYASQLLSILQQVTLLDFELHIAQFARELVEAPNLIDYIATSSYGNLFYSITQVMLLPDYLDTISTVKRVLYDPLVTILFPSMGIDKPLIDQLSVSDLIDYVSTSVSMLNEYLSITLSPAMAVDKNILQAATLLDYISKSGYSSLYESVTLQNYITSIWTRALSITEAITLLDYRYHTTQFIRELAEAPSIVDYISIVFAPIMPPSVVKWLIRLQFIEGG